MPPGDVPIIEVPLYIVSQRTSSRQRGRRCAFNRDYPMAGERISDDHERLKLLYVNIYTDSGSCIRPLWAMEWA